MTLVQVYSLFAVALVFQILSVRSLSLSLFIRIFVSTTIQLRNKGLACQNNNEKILDWRKQTRALNKIFDKQTDG